MWTRVGVFVVLLVAPAHGLAAIDCADPNVTAVHEATPADPRTIAYTTPSGSNRITFIGVGYRHGGIRDTTSVTLGGNATSTFTTPLYINTIIGGQLFYYINPPSGTNDVVVSWAPGAGPLHGDIIIWTCTGVDQVDPFRSTNSSSGVSTGPTVTLGTINTGDVAVDFVMSDDITSITEGANQTALNTGASTSSEAGASYQAGSAGGVMSWTIGASDDWVIFAVALQPPGNSEKGGEALWFP